MSTPWLPLTQPEQIAELAQASHEQPVLIFKHSTTCSISAAAKSKIERQWADSGLDLPIYYLDLLRFRPLSAQIAEPSASATSRRSCCSSRTANAPTMPPTWAFA